jgi:hypothetical protein
VSLAELFTYPTIGGLTKHLAERGGRAKESEDRADRRSASVKKMRELREAHRKGRS